MIKPENLGKARTYLTSMSTLKIERTNMNHDGKRNMNEYESFCCIIAL